MAGSDPIARLTEQLKQLERRRLEHSPAAGLPRVALGIPALDRLLPGQGLARGTLVEWLSAAEGSGAGTLALRAARRICGMGDPEPDLTLQHYGLVVIDLRGEFYPPAAIAGGIDPARLILVQPANRQDRDWALDQTLRSTGVGAVWCWLDEADSRAVRRWQLAAEAGGGVGLLLRPEAARAEPSFADVRLWVESVGSSEKLPALAWTEGLSVPAALGGELRQVRVEVLRARGTAGGGSVTLEIDDETGDVRLAAELADPTRERRATGS
jgi:protein ImuA